MEYSNVIGFVANDGWLASRREVNDGRCETSAIGTRDDKWNTGIDSRYQRVGRSKVNADNSAHLKESK